MSDLDTFGRAAFYGYRIARDESPVIDFDHLPVLERRAWRACAAAVLEATRPAHAPIEHRRLTFKRDTAVTALEVAPLGPKGLVPTLHIEAGDVLMCAPDGSEVYVRREGENVARYVDDGQGVLRPVTT